MRVAVIDSGIHAPHPHVPRVAGGASVLVDPATDSLRIGPGDVEDRLGHGTAVAAAIHEKAPDAELWAVKVFDRGLTTSAVALARAIEYAAESAPLINLSLGTTNGEHAAPLESALRVVAADGAILIAALEANGAPCYPGALPGVVGVRLDSGCLRDELRATTEGDRVVFYASPYPRAIPGIPQERNLSGISFAVANATGFLARLLEGRRVESSAQLCRELGLQAG